MENEFKGTKGKWEVTNVNFPNQISIGTHRETICQTSIAFSRFDKQTAKSNAQLIADAGNVRQQINFDLPELLKQRNKMLKMLKVLLKQIQSDCPIGNDPEFLPMFNKVQDAIKLIKEATTI